MHTLSQAPSLWNTSFLVWSLRHSLLLVHASNITRVLGRSFNAGLRVDRATTFQHNIRGGNRATNFVGAGHKTRLYQPVNNSFQERTVQDHWHLLYHLYATPHADLTSYELVLQGSRDQFLSEKLLNNLSLSMMKAYDFNITDDLFSLGLIILMIIAGGKPENFYTWQKT